MQQQPGQLLRHLRLRSATALVVANIIGAGIFTTTGFQAADLPHPGYILLLWLVGGVLAFSGALCYAELGASLPKAGGEYVYLREIYGPVFGFMSAFVSLVAGFSAAVASACLGFVFYLEHFVPQLTGERGSAGIVVAVSVVWLLIAIHLRGAKKGTGFNDFVTLFKVVGIVGIILAAFSLGKGQMENLTWVAPRFAEISAPDKWTAFATSLIFVMFCYSGWNASAYMASEMRNAQRDLPKSLLAGTLLVVLLYVGLNFVYLYGANVQELAGKAEAGLVASQNLFGPTGVNLVTLVLCVSILASASAMTMAGPRVYFALGKDFSPLIGLSKTNRQTGVPVNALLLQGCVTTLLILSGTIDSIQQYAGFTLTLFNSLAVLGVLVFRYQRPDHPRPFRAWGYPITPLLYVSVSVWMMAWAVRGRPLESLAALGTVVVGGIFFWFIQSRKEPSAQTAKSQDDDSA